MIFSVMVMLQETVYSMFRHVILGKIILMLVGNTVARVWGKYSTSSKKKKWY